MIDLDQFCSRDDNRAFIGTPWSRGEYTFASNGHIGVRVPRRDDVTRDDGPNIEKIFADAAAPQDMRPVPTFDVPEQNTERCAICMGRGFTTDCTDDRCEEGTVICDYDHEHDCEECKGKGEIPSAKGKPNSGPCGGCKGVGRVTTDNATLYCELRPGLYINPAYAAMIASLPNAMIDHGPNSGGGIWFTFDGGEGLLMPLRGPSEIELKHGISDRIIKPKVSEAAA